jgi:GNAT superfamily N-acetyltransferase
MMIRPAVLADADAVAGLAVGFFGEDAGRHDSHTDVEWPVSHGRGYYAAATTDPEAHVLVADIDDSVIGFLVARRKPANPLRPDVVVAELESMYVRPEHRSQRAGGQLVADFRVWALEIGADLLTVTAFAHNVRAHRFYERLGFTPHAITFETTAL